MSVQVYKSMWKYGFQVRVGMGGPMMDRKCGYKFRGVQWEWGYNDCIRKGYSARWDNQ